MVIMYGLGCVKVRAFIITMFRPGHGAFTAPEIWLIALINNIAGNCWVRCKAALVKHS